MSDIHDRSEVWREANATESNTLWGSHVKLSVYFRVLLPDEWSTSVDIQRDIQEHVFNVVGDLQDLFNWQITWTVGYHPVQGASYFYEEGSTGEFAGNIGIQIFLSRPWIRWKDQIMPVLKKYDRTMLNLQHSEFDYLTMWSPQLDREQATPGFRDYYNEEIARFPDSMFYPFTYTDQDDNDSLGS